MEKLSAGWLVPVLRQAETREISEAARCLGLKIQEQDGVGRAVQLIEEWCGRGNR